MDDRRGQSCATGGSAPAPRVSVSVLIPTLDEERNIEACLDSVAWSDDVVVVDSGSRDDTAERARARGARVVQFDWNGKLPKKKNWALENIDWKHEWILILDADERVSAELAAEIPTRLDESSPDAFLVRRRFYFMERWIRHCGYYPSWTLRLFRHSLGRYETLVLGDTQSGDNEVHEHVAIAGQPGRLDNDLLHYAYPDIATWVEKHNRYSNWEARLEIDGRLDSLLAAGGATPRRWLRRVSHGLPFRPSLRFLYSYVLLGGFLDGYPGYALCRLLATYELLSTLKASELRSSRRRDRG